MLLTLAIVVIAAALVAKYEQSRLIAILGTTAWTVIAILIALALSAMLAAAVLAVTGMR